MQKKILGFIICSKDKYCNGKLLSYYYLLTHGLYFLSCFPTRKLALGLLDNMMPIVKDTVLHFENC